MMDDLRLLKGECLTIGNLIVKHPTLQEILDYGEQNYYNIVNLFCSKPYDFMVQLDDMKFDYEKVDSYDLFIMLAQNEFYLEGLNWLCGISDFKLFVNNQSNMYVLYSESTKIMIDKFIYYQIREYLMKINSFSECNEFNPANEITKKKIIERERRKQKRNINKPFKSLLKNQISSLIWANGCGINFDNIWNLSIYQLHDGITRLNKIKAYDNTMNGYYFGTVDLKKIDTEQINWMSDILN